MKRMFVLLFVATFFLLQCGGTGGLATGEGNSEANAQNSQESEPGDLTPSIKSDAITGAGGKVAVDAGFAGDGTTIEIPANFTASQCKFTAAAANISGSAISTSVSINSTTGEVICKKVVQEREEVPAETKGCVASYTVICTN